MRPTLALPRYTGRRLAILVVALAVAATWAATGGMVVAQTPTLTLADFDAAGKEVVLLALIEAGEELVSPGAIRYQSPPRSPVVGSLVAGELGIGPDNAAITRIWFLPSVGQITLNHNTQGFGFGDYLGPSGAGNDLTAHIQSSDGSVSFPASGGRLGGKFANYNYPQAGQNIIAGVGTGDRFILAFYRVIPTPAQVSGVQASALSTTEVSVSWSAAANADGYLVQWATTGQSFDATRQASVTGTSHTIAGLEPNTDYRVQVIATRTNTANAAPSAPPATARTHGLPPAQVSGVVASALSDTEISVSWSEADRADGYLVQWTTAGQSFDDIRQASATGTSHTITGLEYSTEYFIQVVATRTGAANGPPSDPAATATTNAPPPPAQVSAVAASARSDTEISVSWSAAANADGYLVQWATGGQSFDAARQASVAGTSHTITGLEYSTDYLVQVIATRTGAVNGPPSQPANARTNPLAAPARVSAVQASALSDTEINVSWSAVANADGYLVQWATGGQSFDAARQASVAGTSHTITGLQPSTDYRMQVIATRTDAANGPPSGPPATATTNAPPPPAQVSGVVASALSDTEITVSWSPAASATAYVVEWRPDGASHADDRQAVVSGTEVIIEDLEPETEYFIRVFGTRNGAANGPASAEDSAATLESIIKSVIKRFPGGNEIAMQLSLVAFAGVLSGVRFRGRKSPQREAMILGFMCVASMLLPIIGIGSLFWTGGIVLLVAAAAAAVYFLVSK